MTEPELIGADRPELGPEPAGPDQWREQMILQLLEEGVLVDPAIEDAFRAVPREVFAPADVDPRQVYEVHDVVRTRFAADGTALSSLSAPYMQAGNLRQARVEPGMRVLEIGSGGPLASMLTHLVGPAGEVVTVDIDPGVTARTRAGLERIGLADRVEVVTADAARHLGRGLFDRVIVTVAGWTIPPVWLDQLTPDGLLVVPVRLMPGAQRILTFRRDPAGPAAAATGGDRERWSSVETVLGGFVPMQGADVHDHPTRVVTGPSSGQMTFRFAEQVPDGFAITEQTLQEEPALAWSGVIYRDGELWVDLLLWLLLVLPDACEITLDEAADTGHDRPFRVGTVKDDSFAILARRVLPDGSIEVGSVGKGPAAVALTRRVAHSMHHFHTHHRGGDVGFHWWPNQNPHDLPPSVEHPNVRLLARPHGTLTVTWPALASPRAAQDDTLDRPGSSRRGRSLNTQPRRDAR
ncbi:hypothetical protein [Promicromonospora sp. NPDC050262]|uniref:hypothetical protein n=1 Tax=Promicromonospora sp. NPDC050262 TaxID=3155036 RepID=UPI0033E6FBC7